MKPLLIISIVSLAGLFSIMAYDIRGKVSKAAPDQLQDSVIDPNDSIFGFKIGTSEDELFKKLGQPGGYLRLNEHNTAAVYDNERAYIFQDGNLSGIRISQFLIDHSLTDHFSDKKYFAIARWRLDNGIKPEMSLEKVRSLLGDKLKSKSDHGSNYEQYYEDGNSIIYLYFSHYVGIGESDAAYCLAGLLLIPKS